MNRHWELDTLRGLLLVLMVINHLPIRLSEGVSQPVGFVSAAEGFVLLSAWLCGRVYMQHAQREGLPAMRRALWRRAGALYACHAGLLLLLFSVVASVGVHWQRNGLTDLAAWYLEAPLIALPAALALLYQPPLMDVLPLYVLFMLLSAPVLTLALRHGWAGILTASLGVWVLAQFGLGALLHTATVQRLGVPVPFHASGPFSPLAWQLLWVGGLWLGARSLEARTQPAAFPRCVVLPALLLATIGLVWRHAVGQTPLPGLPELNLLFSKWTLGPMRLLNLGALLVLVLHFGPCLVKSAPWLRVTALEVLGRAALPVFCAHLVVVVGVLGVIGNEPWRHPWYVEGMVLIVAFTLLAGVARARGMWQAFRPSKARRPGERRNGPLAVLRAGAPR